MSNILSMPGKIPADAPTFSSGPAICGIITEISNSRKTAISERRKRKVLEAPEAFLLMHDSTMSASTGPPNAIIRLKLIGVSGRSCNASTGYSDVAITAATVKMYSSTRGAFVLPLKVSPMGMSASTASAVTPV